ncbi:ABC transporter permease [Streptomonospora sp. PA3]|uniref:ABC transporter permease n=1 Tax=Streptomonospora sp. PA3 TaxID=2607326 RepID=UPI0012DEE4B9|nr:ABC transporter permease [Streptomonospora sp. PA3]MUL42618.1 ABC transporter permease [Streptomonospora sp. PA3]
MAAQFRSEITKIATTRTWWLLLAGMVALSGMFTAFMVWASANAERSPLQLDSAGSAVVVYNLSVAVAYVFPLALGVLTVTQEYRSRTIAQTLLARPHRLAVFGAKLLAGTCASVLYALVSVGLCAAVAAAMLSGYGGESYLATPEVARALAGSVGVLALWGLIGVALGALVRNQVVAIVGIVLFTQFVEPTARMFAGAVGSPELVRYLPGGAGDTAAGGTVYTMISGGGDAGQGWGLAVLAAYALVCAAAGAVRFQRYEMA